MQKIIGLDIGSYSIKAACIESTLRKFHLTNFYEMRRSAPKDTPEASKSDLIASEIEKFISTYQIDFDQVICSAQGTDVSFKIITLPFKDMRKIDQVITLELENHIPFDINDIVCSYQLIEQTENSSKLLVAVAKKTYIKELLDAAVSLGIDPKQITVDSLSLSNLFSLNLKDKVCPIAIIDLGHRKTNMVIIHNKIPVFVRTISIGGQNVTSAIASAFNVGISEAENIKHERGFVETDQFSASNNEEKKLSTVITPTINSLSKEINQTIKSFEVEYNTKLEEIHLCGGGYRLKNLPAYLSSELSIKCTPLKYLDGEYNRLKDTKGKTTVLPQSLGIALNAVGSHKLSKINLRRNEFAFHTDIGNLKKQIIKYSIMATALFILSIISVSIDYGITKKKNNELTNIINGIVEKTLPDYKAKGKSVQSSLNAIKAKIKEENLKIETLAIGDLKMLDILKEISLATPKEVKIDVKELDVNQGKIRIDGTTDSIESVDKIITGLTQVPFFTNVEKGEVTSGFANEGKRFKISFVLVKKGERK